MKKLIILIACFCTLQSHAQRPLIEPGVEKLWYAIGGYSNDVHPPYETFFSTSIYKLDGDTIMIDNKVYYKIKSTKDSSLTNWSDCEFIYQERNKIYKRYYDEDRLICDFDVQKDSAVKINNNLYKCKYIDSILLLDASHRKRWILESRSDMIYYIEGIGSMGDPFFSDRYSSINFRYVSCYFENGIKLYGDPNKECYKDYIQVGFKQGLSNTDISYSNPVRDKLQLTIGNGSIEEVKLYSIDGRLLRQQKVHDTYLEMDVSALKSGMYLLYVYSRDGVKVEKIIINDELPITKIQIYLVTCHF